MKHYDKQNGISGLAVRTVIYTVLVSVTFCVGCVDEDAAGRRKVHGEFLDVMALIATADQGYVPIGDEIEVRVKVGDQEVVEERRDVEAFRQKVLAQAAQKLQAIVKKGSETQKISARRVLADVYASQSRYVQRQAMATWASIAARSATLMSYLGSVDRADARVRLFDTDEQPLLGQLNKDRQATEVRIDELDQEIRQRQGHIETVAAQMRKLNDRSEQASQQAQNLHGKALVSPKLAKQYELYDQSAKINRRANRDSAAAQTHGVELDVIQSELALLVEQQRIEQQAIQILDNQIAAGRKRQARLPYKQATAEKVEAIEELVFFLGKITSNYRRDVEGELERATNKMNDAIDQVADSSLGVDDDQAIQIERLGHMTDMAHVLTEHIVLAGSHGRTLNAIVQQSERLMPSQSSDFFSEAQRVYLKQRNLIETAKRIIIDAAAGCDQLSRGMPEGDPLVRLAKQQAERLEGYRQRIDEQRLTPPKQG